MEHGGGTFGLVPLCCGMLWSLCLQGLRVEQVEIKRHAALFDVTCEMQAKHKHA